MSPPRGRSFRQRVRVRLACGHVEQTRARPWSATQTFVCTAGAGCGYSVSWVSWVEEGSDFRKENLLSSQDQEKE